MQARKVSLSTGELTYYVAGEGRPILYLHPAGGVRWTRVLEGLAKSFALHVPVVPGFDGTSAHGAVKSMRGLASLVGEFIEKVMARPCDVIGCSFGGYLAAWLAAEHPKLVDHLVLECPAGFRPKGKGERPADAVLPRIRLGRRARDRGRSARAHALAGGKFPAALGGLYGQLGHARSRRRMNTPFRPPFRADQVGSLLRPAEIKKARAEVERGEMNAAELRAIEDRCIREAVARQEAIGLQVVTDGEYRRGWWNHDFLGRIDGAEIEPGRQSDNFAGSDSPRTTPKVRPKL